MGNFFEDAFEVVKNPATIVAKTPLAGLADQLTGGNASKSVNNVMGTIDTSIKDPAGMNQYTDLSNQAQQEYGKQREFMGINVDPRRKQLLDALSAQAAGTAPSIAEAQLKSAFDKSLQQQLASARSQRTGNAGLASRNIGNMAAVQGQNLAQQSAIARLQEQRQAQEGLQNAIGNEMGYATGTLGSALGSQANVAAMQNAQRDRNDSRNKGLFEGGIGAVKSFFLPGMANGGQVQAYAKGGKVKYADGGMVSPSMDMNAADSLLKSKQTAKPPKRTFAQELACGGKTKKMALGGQYQSNVGDVSKFVEDSKKAAAAEEAAIKGFASGMPSKGSSKLETEAPSSKNTFAGDNFKSLVPTMPDDMSKFATMLANRGGNVPGKATKQGDNLENDVVPAILSPGEIVVPRTVVEQGPVAAAHFVKEASNDESYNADTFHAQKKSFAQMLKSIKEDERRYGKVSEILNKKKV